MKAFENYLPQNKISHESKRLTKVNLYILEFQWGGKFPMFTAPIPVD